jgi:hypothetical protein
MDDDFVPASNHELVLYYGDHVKRILMRYNRVATNFEDLNQHIWLELLKTNILKKYADSGKSEMPKQMTAKEACEFLGVTWGQWRTMMWYGQPNAEKSHPTHFRRHHGAITPKPVEGSWCSKKAVFWTDDIIRLHDLDYFTKRSKWEVSPPTTRTRSKFKSYLTTAVHNFFANWCRTRFRKYKEMYLSPHEDGTAWELGIADESSMTSTSIDVRIAITQALGEVFEDDPENVTRVMDLLKEGYTLVEIAKEMKLPTRIVEKVRTVMLGSTEVHENAVEFMMS